MKSMCYYSVSDADFMKELKRHATAVASNGGGIIYLSDDEYEQAKRIAKTADVFKWKWFKLYYAGVRLCKERKFDELQPM
jgi:hypothetical protein